MNNFKIELPTKVYFGNNCVLDALLSEKSRINGHILLVCGCSEASAVNAEKMHTWISSVNPDAIVTDYRNPHSNPRLDDVREAAKQAWEKNVHTIIAIGGGSVMDLAKAVAVAAVSEEDIGAYFGTSKELPENTLPIIAVPTTAGTGSELSKAAILTDSAQGVKDGIRGACLAPKVAIVDPELTYTVPLKTTMETGFDVLAHAVESFLSRKADLYSEMLSARAISIVGESLPLLKRFIESREGITEGDIDPSEKEAREKMLFASMLMGINLYRTGNCLPHRMQYPIGALTDTSHGAGLAALFPAWIGREFEVNRDKVQEVFSYLGYPADDIPTDGREVRKIFYGFLKNKLGIGYSLKGLGVKQSAEELAPQVRGNLKSDILSETPDILIKIYEESMGE
ncbi:MAG: iron-containing alcohol dehydrogenase [Lachnospiraceae bacterium]|nr:iron-containing alcohol dehydrogenase [Lachnospiraceae bacterium]